MVGEPHPRTIAENKPALAESVVALARGLAGELDARKSIQVALDSDLESDLGIESLTRIHPL